MRRRAVETPLLAAIEPVEHTWRNLMTTDKWPAWHYSITRPTLPDLLQTLAQDIGARGQLELLNIIIADDILDGAPAYTATVYFAEDLSG